MGRSQEKVGYFEIQAMTSRKFCDGKFWAFGGF
jgi:hypothetical protein